MTAQWLKGLLEFVQKRPLAFVRFTKDDLHKLAASRRGFTEFTIARPHEELAGIRVPCPCLLCGDTDAGPVMRFGAMTSRTSVTTLETRTKLRDCAVVQPSNEKRLLNLPLAKIHLTRLKQILHEPISVIRLTPSLSAELLKILASIPENLNAIRAIAHSLAAPTTFSDVHALQMDGVRMALKVFGLAPSAQAATIRTRSGKRSALAGARLREDSVVEHDARNFPECRLIESDTTGRAVFEGPHGNLEVFTANRRPLEKVFGVDLIYLNTVRRSLTMVQYKMLEPIRDKVGEDWIYRPDGQLQDEIARMLKFRAKAVAKTSGYRLNAEPFYLKFVKRDRRLETGGIVVPLEHFQALSKSPACNGPRGAVRISYRSLEGVYLRESTFIDLIRSGYIGSEDPTTEAFMLLICELLHNDRAVVGAIESAHHLDLESVYENEPDFT